MLSLILSFTVFPYPLIYTFSFSFPYTFLVGSFNLSFFLSNQNSLLSLSSLAGQIDAQIQYTILYHIMGSKRGFVKLYFLKNHLCSMDLIQTNRKTRADILPFPFSSSLFFLLWLSLLLSLNAFFCPLTCIFPYYLKYTFSYFSDPDSKQTRAIILPFPLSFLLILSLFLSDTFVFFFPFYFPWNLSFIMLL